MLFCLPSAGPAASAFRGWAAALGPEVDVQPVAEPPESDPAALAQALAARADPRPYAIYGHSTGGRLGFEVVRELHRRGARLPLRLYVGGCRPPPRPDRAEPLPVPVVAFAGASDPVAPAFDMLGWAAWTAAGFSLRTEPGDQRFLHQRGERLAAAVRADLLAAGAVAERPLEPPDADEVHVWSALLADLPALAAATGELSPAERERAARFRRPVDRDRYVARSVLLRRLLTRYGAPVGTAELPTGARGKPRLPGGQGLRFNTSHSAGSVLVAVTSGQEVGVDIEWIRPLNDLDALCAGMMHPDELAEHRRLPEDRRLEHALTVWTAKEAVLKASGDGLGVEPGQLSFAAQPAGPWRPRVPAELARLGRWQVRHLALPGRVEAVGAVALERDRWRLRFEAMSSLYQ